MKKRWTIVRKPEPQALKVRTLSPLPPLKSYMSFLFSRRISGYSGNGVFISGGQEGRLYKKGFLTSFSDERSPMRLVRNSSLPRTKFVHYAVELTALDIAHLGLPSLPGNDFWCAVPPCSSPSVARERGWLGSLCNASLAAAQQNAKMTNVYVPGQGLFVQVHLLRDVYVPPGKTVQVLISYGEKYTARLVLSHKRRSALEEGRKIYGVGTQLINCSGCCTARPRRELFHPCPNVLCPSRRGSRVKARGCKK